MEMSHIFNVFLILEPDRYTEHIYIYPPSISVYLRLARERGGEGEGEGEGEGACEN